MLALKLQELIELVRDLDGSRELEPGAVNGYLTNTKRAWVLASPEKHAGARSARAFPQGNLPAGAALDVVLAPRRPLAASLGRLEEATWYSGSHLPILEHQHSLIARRPSAALFGEARIRLISTHVGRRWRASTNIGKF